MDGKTSGTVYDVIDLGFDPNVARRAVAATNNAGVEQAVDWIFKNAPPAGNSTLGSQNLQAYSGGRALQGGGLQSRGSQQAPVSDGAKDNSVEFLSHALVQVGFRESHARRAVIATNMQGVPQAIEWALSHLGDETPPHHTSGFGSNQGKATSPPSSEEEEDPGLVVELPDGKLFKLKHPNGRVVEMPNGNIVEMLDGQVVEMTNGQQLEMVEGALVEITGPTLHFDENEVVGHHIFSVEESVRVKAVIRSGQSAARNPPSGQGVGVHKAAAETGDGGGGQRGSTQSYGAISNNNNEWGIGRQPQAQQQSEQARNGVGSGSINSSSNDVTAASIASQQQKIRSQEEEMRGAKTSLQLQQESLAQQSQALNNREAELQMREEQAARWRAELQRNKERLQGHENSLREREKEAASLASRASTVNSSKRGGRAGAGGAGAAAGSEEDEDNSAMGNIEAGRIRFHELTLGTLLGSGSFADVYRAEWRMPCAVKKMKGKMSKEQMTEFIREGEMMRQLKHPGIVKLLGISVDSGSFYLVQEVVNGHGNLFDYLHKKNQRLNYWQVVEIGKRVCDAMAYLHSKHIVHRDLKPQNCLLVNEKGEVKLCDFGLARLKKTAFVETVSNTAGTPAYQAPEMLRDEPISEKVDQYGMGIMLWEMYTGALPWSDKNYHQMIHTVAVRNERPPITPDMPRELVSVIEACWHPIPAKRPSFSELRASFKELQKLVAHLAPTSSAPQQQQPQQPSHVTPVPASRQQIPGQGHAVRPPQQHQQGQYYQAAQHGGGAQRGVYPQGQAQGQAYAQGW